MNYCRAYLSLLDLGTLQNDFNSHNTDILFSYDWRLKVMVIFFLHRKNVKDININKMTNICSAHYYSFKYVHSDV